MERDRKGAQENVRVSLRARKSRAHEECESLTVYSVAVCSRARIYNEHVYSIPRTHAMMPVPSLVNTDARIIYCSIAVSVFNIIIFTIHRLVEHKIDKKTIFFYTE